MAPELPGHSPQRHGSLESKQVSIPDGMVEPKYPPWATEADPDVPNQMTAVVARLFELFGRGTPATSELPEFPFNTSSGEKSGINAYDDLRADFQRIEAKFSAAAKAYQAAVQNSADVTHAGRNAINNAISTFNGTTAALENGQGNWDGLIQAESKLLDTVKTAVDQAARSGQSVSDNPFGGSPGIPLPGFDTPTPAVVTPAPAQLASDHRAGGKGRGGLNGLGRPLGGVMSMGGNPLGGLGGLNPLGGGMGNGIGSGGGGLSPRSNAGKPLSKLSDDMDYPKDEVSPIKPLDSGPQNHPPAAAPAGNAVEGKPTVCLPDGKVVDALGDPHAAQAAQNALDNASPGGDAAQKAYNPTGFEMPSDGQALGARVDPSDVQAGDVLKWHGKTMVAVAAGLVADPTQPGVTHPLDEVLKDQKGFEGIFRPTEHDPTLTAPPPPTPPPGDAAPPSPFEPPIAPTTGKLNRLRG